jgi:hypothetical protein
VWGHNERYPINAAGNRGALEIRRFAYIWNDADRPTKLPFGLLNADSYQDARKWLGSRYRIKTVWIDEDLDIFRDPRTVLQYVEQLFGQTNSWAKVD